MVSNADAQSDWLKAIAALMIQLVLPYITSFFANGRSDVDFSFA